MPIRQPKSSSARFAILIAAALLAKALVPAGWMPVFEDGRLALRLCGGWAPARAGVAAAHGHHEMGHGGAAPAHQHEEGERQGADQPCSFAAAGLSWTGAEPVRAEVPGPAREAVVRRFPRAVAIGRGLAAPPPPATGPPLTA